MAKPVLFWGIIRGSLWSDTYTAIRVTRETVRQISGVRSGEISAVTLNKCGLKGRFRDETSAQEAIKHAGDIRKPYDAEIKRLDILARDQRQQREAHENKVFSEFPGSMKAGECL